MVWTTLVTLLVVALLIFFTMRVGFNRGKLGVSAPAMAGNEDWEKLCRVHLNTVEQALVFLPVLWIAAHTSSDTLAAGIGAVWIVGRVLYSQAYIKNPAKRAPGMLLTLLPTVALLIIGLVGVIGDLVG